MTKTSTWLPALLILAAQAAWSSSNARAQDPPVNPPAPPTEKPTEKPGIAKDAEAVQFIKDVTAQFGKQADADAKAAIKKLVEIWKDKEVTDATKKPIPDLLERYGKQDVPSLAIAAIEGLSELGSAGTPPVIALLNRTMKAKEPQSEMYKACFAALKKLADPKAATIKTIEDFLDYKTDDVIAKAADAIAGYKDAPGKVRRDLLQELIKQFEGVYNASRDAKNSAQVSKWNVVGGAVVSAMNALSGQSFKDPAQARAWFNDHKDDKSWK